MINDLFSTISVIGLGYIGLPTAAVIASRKIKVIGIDVNPHIVETINRGEIHIVEPELDMLVHATVTEGYFRATLIPEPADAFLIAVPTPFKENHEPDLSYIEAACRAIATVLKKGDLVILESTSPVGTTEQVAAWLTQMRPDLTYPQLHGAESDISIAYCPERVLPGHVLRELIENDRVIGGLTKRCIEKAMALYQLFVEGDCLTTDVRTAEMCKLIENSFRDVNIAFANELSMICAQLNINVWELIHLANRHPRVNILQPGPGVGGHCIAVDPWFIVSKSPQLASLIRTAREVNDSKPLWVIQKVRQAVGEYLQTHPNKTATEVTIVCLGLTFKADIDDLRESPALGIATEIAKMHAGRVLVVEPHISHLPSTLIGLAELEQLEEGISEATLIIKLVGHKAFAHVSRQITSESKYLDFVGNKVAVVNHNSVHHYEEIV